MNRWASSVVILYAAKDPEVLDAGSLVPGGAAVAFPLICASALPSVKRAWEVLRYEKRLNVDSLDTLAIVVSLAHGQVFTAAFIAWMINLGHWIRDKTAGKSKRVLAELLEFQASATWMLRNQEVVRVPANSILTGEVVIVYPGELIPGMELWWKASLQSTRKPSPANRCRRSGRPPPLRMPRGKES